MPMSKKHYEAVAAAINNVLWEPEMDPATMTRVIVVLGQVFKADNQRFDQHRFLTACLKDRNTVLQPGWDAYKAERERLGI